MRKILPILLAALIIFPAVTVQAWHDAAQYIPHFNDMASNSMKMRIRFIGMEESDIDGVFCRIWKYRVEDDKTSAEEYVDKYTRKLTSKSWCELVGSTRNERFFVVESNWDLKKIGGICHFFVTFDNTGRVYVVCTRGIIPDTKRF